MNLDTKDFLKVKSPKKKSKKEKLWKKMGLRELQPSNLPFIADVNIDTLRDFNG